MGNQQQNWCFTGQNCHLLYKRLKNPYNRLRKQLFLTMGMLKLTAEQTL